MSGPAAQSGSSFSVALGGGSGDIEQKEYARREIFTGCVCVSERVNETFRSLILKNF